MTTVKDGLSQKAIDILQAIDSDGYTVPTAYPFQWNWDWAKCTGGPSGLIVNWMIPEGL